MVLSLTRPTDPPRFFDSWRDYLESWGGDASDRTFCRALMSNYQPLLKPQWDQVVDEIERYQATPERDDDVDRALREAEAALSALARRVGFPWVTPVIGSGCLSATEGPEAQSIARVPGQIAFTTAEWGTLPDGSSVSEVTRHFAENLLATKLVPEGSWDGLVGSGQEDSDIDRTVCAHVLLCAYLMSRLYFEVGAVSAAPVGSTTLPLSFDTRLDGPMPRGAEIDDALRRPLLTRLKMLQQAIDSRAPEELAFVAKFAAAVATDLESEPPLIRGSDAALMSEIAWHFMTEGTTQYPGWSDLLVLLNFAFNSTEREHRWPHLTDLGSARQTLAQELKDTTELSWGSRFNNPDTDPADPPSQRDRLYDTVASILTAQAGLSLTETLDVGPNVSRDGALESYHTDAYPPAVAFVTSFDLELEMSLLASRTRFRLIMPFYVRRSGSSAAVGYVWLQTVIDPPPTGDELALGHIEALYRPVQWSLLSTHPTRQDELPGLPAIVRLAGSPLVEGPHLLDAEGSWADKLREQLGRRTSLVGTVLLDEHTALQQWAADLGTSLQPNPHDQRDRLGLPGRFVAGVNEDTDARFWFLLGVPLSDDGVRHRSAALVGAADLRGGLSSRVRTTRPRRTGVIVNRRSTPDQRDVFLWQGLDVVAATYKDVLPALMHAADHAAYPEHRRIVGDECMLSRNLA